MLATPRTYGTMPDRPVGSNERLFQVELFFGEDNPGIVGIEMVTGEKRYSAKVDPDIAFADTLARRAGRRCGHGLDAQVQLFQVVYLAHGAIYHNAFPLILHRQVAQFGVDQRSPDRTAAVDHQHPAKPILLEYVVKQTIILEAFHGNDLAAK